MTKAKAKALRVVFTRSYTVQSDDGKSYEPGDVETFEDERSLNHFVRRGVAVDVTGKTPAQIKAIAGATESDETEADEGEGDGKDDE